MQWSPFLFILMGSLITCQLYEYHFIEEKKTWLDAQMYCRDNYTDLATVYDMTYMSRLRESTESQGEAWIGLHYKSSEAKGICGQPTDEKCVVIWKHYWHLHWWYKPCTEKHGFICYDGKSSDRKFHLVNEMKTWREAQSYCQKNHMGLFSGLNQLEDGELEIENSHSQKYWVGRIWRWSDGTLFSFRHWDDSSPDNKTCKEKCAMTMLNEEGRWKTNNCGEKKSFFCYDNKVILIKENKTWEEALYYCREKYHDLVSITNHHQQRWAQARAKMADSPYVWLGLRYTCTLEFWFWVSDDVVSYENWASPGKKDECDMSGAMERGGEHQWFSRRDNETFNFICSRY